MDHPLSAHEAKTCAKEIVENGIVSFTQHSQQELGKDDLEANLRDLHLPFGIAHSCDHSLEKAAMKCEECGAPMTVERNGVRRYVIGGLPHVELHGVEVSLCPQCGAEELGIPRIEQLHRALASAFVRQPRMVAPAELRFLRKHLGLSAGDFSHMMGVARETVSRWETGAKPMGSVADRLLRLLVLSHTPTESYEVDDLLKELTDDPAPERLASVAMWNNSGHGWLTQEEPPSALVST